MVQKLAYTVKCTPDDPHFYEKFYFTPGDLGFKTIPHEKGKEH
jgi:hypothetical protein